MEVDSDANRSLQFLLGETWAKSQRSWDLFPSSIYLILKYEDNLTASLMANAQLPGERAARAVAIGLVLGAYHGLQAVQALRNSCHAFDKALKLLRRLPLFRPSFLLPTNNETPLTDVPWMKGQLPSVLCFDTLFTALSCCGANEHDNLACWGPEGMKERCCDCFEILSFSECVFVVFPHLMVTCLEKIPWKENPSKYARKGKMHF